MVTSDGAPALAQPDIGNTLESEIGYTSKVTERLQGWGLEARL